MNLRPSEINTNEKIIKLLDFNDIFDGLQFNYFKENDDEYSIEVRNESFWCKELETAVDNIRDEVLNCIMEKCDIVQADEIIDTFNDALDDIYMKCITEYHLYTNLSIYIIDNNTIKKLKN